MAENTIQRSEIVITDTGHASALTTSRIFKPLKIFQLQKGKCCQIVFSNYGGGFVAGDDITAQVVCQKGSTSAFTTQANTRVYKSESGLTARQNISGRLEEGSFTVFLGDPIVPHGQSKFEQKIFWTMHRHAVLLWVDWFEAGRILNGERFDFEKFTTEFKVEYDSKIILWDKFKINPCKSNVNSPGEFSDNSSYLNVFLIGNENIGKVKLLENALKQMAEKHFQEENPKSLKEAQMLGTSVKVSDHVFMIRCSALSQDLLIPLVKELTLALSNPALLGFNISERKF